MYVLFNKDKEFVGYSDDIPPQPNLNIFRLEIPENRSDITKWKWQGDMFTGKMVEIKE